MWTWEEQTDAETPYRYNPGSGLNKQPWSCKSVMLTEALSYFLKIINDVTAKYPQKKSFCINLHSMLVASRYFITNMSVVMVSLVALGLCATLNHKKKKNQQLQTTNPS